MSTNSSLPSFCPHCGAAVTSTSSTCAVCGRSLLTYGSAGNTQGNTFYPPLEEDIPSTPFNILAFFVPVAGVVLFALWSGQYPRKSKAVGMWALIGFLTPFMIWVFFMIIFFLFAVVSFSR